jgi:hypothetical protein
MAKPKEPSSYPVERVPIGKLSKHPRNYKKHPPEQVAHIADSIRQHGFYRDVVVASDWTILAGHGVVEAATSIGLREVPVKRLPIGPDDPRALKILATDNELGKFAESDDRMLANILKEVSDKDPEALRGTGFDERSLAAFVMVTRPPDQIRKIDENAEWVGMPEYDGGATPILLTISFDDEAARKEFVAKKQLKVVKTTGRTWSVRWPEVENEDVHAVRFGTK